MDRPADQRETMNAIRDLNQIASRWEQGVYRQTDVLARNVFDVPRRTDEFFSYVESYRKNAAQWTRLFLELEVENIERILHVLPGWSPKVELGLLRTKFQGCVELLDLSPAHTDRLINFLALFPAPFSVLPVHEDVYACSRPAAPLVIANHVLDDLLLAEELQSMGSPPLDALYDDEEVLCEVAKALCEHGIKQGVVRRLAKLLEGMVADQGVLVCTHYKSHMSRLLGLDALEERMLEAWELLVKDVTSYMPHKDLRTFGEGTLLLCRRG